MDQNNATENVTDQVIIGNLFNFEYAGPDDAAQWGGEYRTIQWNNNEIAAEFPQKHWIGSEIELNYEVVDIEHGEAGEVIEPGFLLDIINISVISHRSVWEVKGPDGEMMYTQDPDFSVAKWNKRYNFLCILQEACDFEPVILTAKAHTGQFIYKTISQARKRNVGLVKRLTGRSLPGYLFWITLTSPGKKGKRIVGNKKKNTIYPPVALVHDVAKLKKPDIITLLESLYVGDEIRNLYEEGLYENGQEWAAKQEQLVLPDGNGANGKALTVSTEVSVNEDGTLLFPDLSVVKPATMIDCGASLPGLFDNRSHASNAFAKMLRQKNLASVSDGAKWNAWRTELEVRWEHKVALDADIACEAELRDRPAMDEVEADAEIPPAFR